MGAAPCVGYGDGLVVRVWRHISGSGVGPKAEGVAAF